MKVGQAIGVIATGTEKPEEVKKKYAGKTRTRQRPPRGQAGGVPKPEPSAKSAASPPRWALRQAANYQYDIVVIGGGPAGYAAAIRAGQLKKRVLVH